MPLFRLNREIAFPHPSLAEPEGILACGGDLSPQRLLAAYSQGIFPWYEENEPILWWSPDPRFVLFTAELHVPERLGRILKQGRFRVTCDRDFAAVIGGCRQPRRTQEGTWITPAMAAAYIRLHKLGYAHSAEAWQDDELAGGVYGVSLGHIFFAESMFYRRSNASKVALVSLCRRLRQAGFPLIDCQVRTGLVEGLGGRPIPRSEYLRRLNEELKHESLRGDWGKMFGAFDKLGDLR